MTEQPAPPNPAGAVGAVGQAATRRRALWWATVLCDRPDAPDPWALGDQDDEAAESLLREVTSSMLGDENDPGMAAVDVVLARGGGGLVVLLHQPRWSVAARAGGPLVVVCGDYPDGLVIQGEMPLNSGAHLERTPARAGSPNAAELVEALIAWARVFSHHGKLDSDSF